MSISNKKKRKKSGNSNEEKDNSQKSILSLGFVQVKEGNKILMPQRDKTNKNNNEEANSSHTILSKDENQKKNHKKPKSESNETGKRNIESNTKNNVIEIISNENQGEDDFIMHNDEKQIRVNNVGGDNDNNIQNPNFNQQFFNYKSFIPSVNTTTNANKRKHSFIQEEECKRKKKVNKNWITKEANKKDKITELQNEEDLNVTNNQPLKSKSNFSDEEISNTNTNKHSNHLSELKSLIDTNMHVNYSNHFSNSNHSTNSNKGIGTNESINNNKSINNNPFQNILSNPNIASIGGKEVSNLNTIEMGNKSKYKNALAINTLSNSQSKQSSQVSLEFNSRIQSKDKNYNFDNHICAPPKEEEAKKLTKFNDYLQFKKANQKIQQRDSLIDKINNSMSYSGDIPKEKDKGNNVNSNNNINSNNNNGVNPNAFAIPDTKIYNLELKTYEDTAYDEFYKLKHNKKNNRKSMPLNNKTIKPKNLNLFSGVNNQKNKKERELMQGFKCDLCEKFYDIFDEKQNISLCNECSRHRAIEKPNSTPKGFYDLSF